MADIKLISDGKKNKGSDDEKLKATVTFKNDEVKEYVCDFMGQSSEYSPLMVFLNEDGDEVFPVAMINSDEMRHIKIEALKDGGDMGS